MTQRLAIPTYHQGFAPRDGVPEYPGLHRQLIGHWSTFLGITGVTLRDQAGRQNDGSFSGGLAASDWLITERGWALDMNGSSDEVALGIDAFGLGIRRHATFYTYVKPTASATFRCAMGDWASSAGGFSIRINNNDTLTFFVYPNDHRITTTATVNEGEWNSIVGVMDGANMFLYLNGLQVGTQTLGEDIGNDTGNIFLGARNGTANWFLGQHAGGTIWDRALKAPEIMQLHVDPYALTRLRRRTALKAPVIAGTSTAWWHRHFIIQGGNAP